MASTFNTELVQGDTFQLQVTILDDAGSPVDLTDLTLTGQVALTYGTASVLDFVIGDGITVEAPETGVLQISKALPVALEGNYVYDFRMSGAGVVTTFLRGTLKLLKRAAASA